MPALRELWRRLPLAAAYQARNVRCRFQLCPGVFYSTQPPSSDVTVQYNHGLPVVTLTLPSRNERCQFTIKPLTTTVGQFLKDIQKEDQGIDRLAAISTDGTKFSSSTLMNVLLKNDFQLLINKSTHNVKPPPIGKGSDNFNSYSPCVSISQDYVYPEVTDRQFLHIFYKKAKVKKFDIEKYNRLKNEFAEDPSLSDISSS
ncbi:hypothetical protein GDO81_000662 [Engystomops pustulosus]|uniref:Calcium uniporter protein n=1 Tax=Engystomops pustulosus TaxID=76066 RepID=A0AAV7D7F2_ENGPU|nr:hypothetical protein GDO81_000662 [Engystomops pustulosus]